MPDNHNLGPPGPRDGEGGPSPRPATVEESDNSTTNNASLNAPSRQCHADTLAGLRRRRKASQRLERLDCGCVDVSPHRCTRPPLSDKQVAAAAAAAHHLRDVNLTPVFDPPTLQALWRSGRRQLVDELRGGGR